MFKKILIANRGEIAVRILRACRDLKIKSVAVYSTADRNGYHVTLADEAYEIGPAPSHQSYLNIDKVIEVAKSSGADAVHPGYGFLSENATFAKRLKKENITFIGPSPKTIETMGDKIKAKEVMKQAGVPIVPGSTGSVDTIEDAKQLIKKIGLPVLIKAAAGGGGKGMRLVQNEKDLSSAFRSARSEAQNYFSNNAVYIERFIQNPKHIEIQVFGDTHGNVIHLFDRECSIQRRHQKIIEEAPSPSVPQDIREKMGQIAVNAAKQIHYIGAGTFEFIFDNTTKEFFFMEMNTRLQVEHPVTEMITGFDLVQEQIFVAAGEKLSKTQDEIQLKGHAIEARICAEDPVSFMPSPGLIRKCRHPHGPFVRVDSCAYSNCEIPIHYDPMFTKVICWGHNRDEAIKRLNNALTEFFISGIKTNIVLHRSILKSKKFIEGSYTTNFLDSEFKQSQSDLFQFIDDRIFLISAVIEAYKEKRTQGISSDDNKWKRRTREEGLR